MIISKKINKLENRICRKIQDLHASFVIKERRQHRGHFAKLYIPVQSLYPQGSKLSLFSLYGQRFPRYWQFSKLPYLGMKLFHWQKFQKLHIYSLSTHKGSKLSLFSPHRQLFPRYWPIFNIAIFGHETWPLAKVSEVAQILSFYPRGSK